MFSKQRIAMGLALLLALITSMTVYAKGAFSFIAITGGDLKEEVRVTDAGLTENFFAFADFHINKTKAPDDPGIGYEITRYYTDGKREIIFDRLHYYPDTGYVFYDGLVNGSSEYDDKWYIAKSEIKDIFEETLAVVPMAKPEPLKSNEQAQSGVTIDPTQSVITVSQLQLYASLVVIGGLALIIVFALRRRKAVSQ